MMSAPAISVAIPTDATELLSGATSRANERVRLTAAALVAVWWVLF